MVMVLVETVLLTWLVLAGGSWFDAVFLQNLTVITLIKCKNQMEITSRFCDF